MMNLHMAISKLASFNLFKAAVPSIWISCAPVPTITYFKFIKSGIKTSIFLHKPKFRYRFHINRVPLNEENTNSIILHTSLPPIHSSSFHTHFKLNGFSNWHFLYTVHMAKHLSQPTYFS